MNKDQTLEFRVNIKIEGVLYPENECPHKLSSLLFEF